MTSLLIIGLVVLAIAVPTCALFAFGVYLGATEEKAPPPPVAARNGQPDDSGIVTLVAHGASRSIAVDDEAV